MCVSVCLCVYNTYEYVCLAFKTSLSKYFLLVSANEHNYVHDVVYLTPISPLLAIFHAKLKACLFVLL